MNTTHSSAATRLKVGIFTLIGFLVILMATVLSNNRPFWWRSCQLVKINVEDATGLKTKAPIRSLGIEIGYLKSVMLTEHHVTLGICITAPVEILPSTRAYIRGEGLLVDKFVELKPVKYLNKNDSDLGTENSDKNSKLNFLFPQAWAANAEPSKQKGGREIPVGSESQDIQHLVNRVDELVNQMTGLTNNLKQGINPDDLRKTMKQLNQTLENASKTLAPEGGLNQTAQRTLAKLEDAIEQLRDQLTRVNQGKGSVGMLLNDPTYAEEIRLAIKNVNRLLNKVADVRFVVDIGGAEVTGYNGGRGWFQLGIWPNPTRYYLLGIATDPRGRISNTTITTTAGGYTQTTQTQVVDQTQILFTAMLGKVFFNRIDLSVGALYGDGAASVLLKLGPNGNEKLFQLRNDVYFRNSDSPINDRITLQVQPHDNVYLRGGLEAVTAYPGTGQSIFFYGAGITFDDEDIKLLFAFK
jgi:phospholipid/cholesterol/gamma-HCH transport system substrate-binding protein